MGKWIVLSEMWEIVRKNLTLSMGKFFKQLSTPPKNTISLTHHRQATDAEKVLSGWRKTIKMQWTRSETLALAQQSCTFCYGLGLRPGRSGASTPCNCVFRAIFRACYARFRQCTSKEKYVSRVSLEANPGRQRKSVWGLKNEEFIADFCLVSRRTLDEQEYQIFRYHFLLGADWKLCCRKLKMDRGTFFHEVYRIQQKLGRTFRELEPHALFPVDQYFNGSGRAPVEPSSFPVETETPAKPAPVIKFPIKRAA